MQVPSMREFVLGGAAFALFGTVVASALQGPFDPKSEMIFVGDKAVALLPPVVVAKGQPKLVAWSHDGKSLFVESEDVRIDAKALAAFVTQGGAGKPTATSESVLSIFDADKNSSRELARYKSDGSRVQQVEWLPGERNMVFTAEEPFRRDDGTPGSALSLYFVSASSGKVSRLARFKDMEYAAVFTDPRAKGAVIAVQDGEAIKAAIESGGKPVETHWTATWLGTDGKLGAEMRIDGRMRPPYWTPSGKGPYFDNPIRDPETKKVVPQTFLLDFASRSAIQVPTPDLGEMSEKKLGFRVQIGQSANVADTAQVSRRSLWLRSDEQSENQYALVAADAEASQLSPTGTAVYYETKGVAMVRPLLSMPKDMAISALNAAERLKAMSDSKQAALALIIYAADYDDNFPSNAGDWAEAVNPYVKNREILDGFTYTYSGGPMSDIAKPAETEIGYKLGPGGRAVAYADGHVKWIPNPKKEQNLSALRRPCSGALLGPTPPSSRPSFSSA